MKNSLIKVACSCSLVVVIALVGFGLSILFQPSSLEVQAAQAVSNGGVDIQEVSSGDPSEALLETLPKSPSKVVRVAYSSDSNSVSNSESYLGSYPEGYSDTNPDNLGYLPPDPHLSDAENRGRQTWYFWTGGNESFFRRIAKDQRGEVDFLSLLDARPDDTLFPGDTHHPQRNERFKNIGAINDPGCRVATQPDEYGLWLDVCDDPQSTGIMGARKFPNPNFDAQQWDIAKYYQAGEERAQLEPPYRIGISCGVCHIGFNPVKPPENPEEPLWENLIPAIGNQYLSEGALFGGTLSETDFRRQVLDSQPRGTSDTSRIATDHIDNPNVINAIFNLGDRPRYPEEISEGQFEAVPHILKDGADSIGVARASERVYINIGMCSELWLQKHDALLGRRPQEPFDIQEAEAQCEGDNWNKTAARMADAEAFLATLTPLHLADAPGGDAYLTQDEAVLTRGKMIFADTCAQCHTSKRPTEADIQAISQQQQINLAEASKQWYRNSVLSPDFLEHNFLSDDQRHPVTEIGTNAARALGTNATAGHIWDQFSSKTYKELPSPGTLTLGNPFDEDNPIEFEVPDGGVGYYRTPSLISVWSSAPFFQNNGLGLFNGDPSVSGRMVAFNDAIEKLLWPEKREGVIKRTTRETQLDIGALENVTVPEGTPIKLLANLDPNTVPQPVKSFLISDPGDNPLVDFVGGLLSPKINFFTNLLPQPIASLLVKFNTAPDFYEDHGHLFGTDLPDDDKWALIEFLKTL